VPGAGVSSNPALAANGIVYFTLSPSTGTPETETGYLYALRAADGVLLWKYDIGWGNAPVLSADGTLYVSGWHRTVDGTEAYKLHAFRSWGSPQHGIIHHQQRKHPLRRAE
jgi:outer membrane protein assembly factor BamB